MIKLCLAISVLLCLGEALVLKDHPGPFGDHHSYDDLDSPKQVLHGKFHPREEVGNTEPTDYKENYEEEDRLKSLGEKEGDMLNYLGESFENGVNDIGEQSRMRLDPPDEQNNDEVLIDMGFPEEQKLPYKYNLVRTTAVFQASVEPSIQDTYPYSTVLFSDVVTNMRGSYNKSSGEFRVPADGNYVFYYNILSSAGKLKIALQVNGQTKLLLYSDVHSSSSSTAYTTVGNQLVLSLNADDYVRMVTFPASSWMTSSWGLNMGDGN